MNTSSTLTALTQPRRAIVHALANSIAWAINATTWATGRAVAVHTLSIDECETAGVPEGTTEPHVYVFHQAGASWWRLDAWNDDDDDGGEGCFHIRALGMYVEVHHEEASAVEPAGT